MWSLLCAAFCAKRSGGVGSPIGRCCPGTLEFASIVPRITFKFGSWNADLGGGGASKDKCKFICKLIDGGIDVLALQEVNEDGVDVLLIHPPYGASEKKRALLVINPKLRLARPPQPL